MQNQVHGSADFVVVGAGAAGSLLAFRLAAAGASVVLLEAGGSSSHPRRADPNEWYRLLLEDTGSQWLYTTVPQERLGRRVLRLPQGKALGGSCAINAMIYARGIEDDFVRWAEHGCRGWRYAYVEAGYEQVERSLRPVRGKPDDVARAIFAGAQDLGIPYIDDYNDGERYGATTAQYFWTSSGKRQTSYDALVRANPQQPIAVRPQSVVRRVLVERTQTGGLRATGVEIDVDGQCERILAPVVVLAAGAIGTPLILLRSGIGARQSVENLGVTPRVDLQGVGANLCDDLFVPLAVRAKRRVTPLPPALVWASTMRDPRAALDAEISFGGSALPGLADAEEYLWMFCSVMHLESRGRIQVGAGGEVLVDPAYLAAAADQTRCCEALRLLHELATAPALRDWVEPPPKHSREHLREHVVRSAGTTHHYCGTCAMGDDPKTSVVDERLRVWGVDGIVVSDMSVAPTPVTGNPAATAMMIAERAADQLLGQADRLATCTY